MLALIGACSAPPGETPLNDELLASSSAALSTADAISRAEEWVAAKLLYCQSANGKADGDTACPSICER